MSHDAGKKTEVDTDSFDISKRLISKRIKNISSKGPTFPPSLGNTAPSISKIGF
jgi:hypothetical protein